MPASSSKASSSQQPGQQRKRLSSFEKDLVIRWLEDPDNFRLITGNVKGPVESGKAVSKTHAYQELAQFVNRHHPEREWAPMDAKRRYESILKTYKGVRHESNETGYGLCEADLKKGVKSIEEKRERQCFGYARLDALFGARQNITPSVNVQIGVGSESAMSSQHDADVSSLNCVEDAAGDCRTLSEGSSSSTDPGADGNDAQGGDLGTDASPKRPSSTWPPRDKNTKRTRRDFTTVYTKYQERQLAFEREKYEDERRFREQDLRLREREYQLKVQTLKADLVKDLAAQGKTIAEIREILGSVFPDSDNTH